MDSFQGKEVQHRDKLVYSVRMTRNPNTRKPPSNFVPTQRPLLCIHTDQGDNLGTPCYHYSRTQTAHPLLCSQTSKENTQESLVKIPPNCSPKVVSNRVLLVTFHCHMPEINSARRENRKGTTGPSFQHTSWTQRLLCKPQETAAGQEGEDMGP